MSDPGRLDIDVFEAAHVFFVDKLSWCENFATKVGTIFIFLLTMPPV
jgi:hypothetical protein